MASTRYATCADIVRAEYGDSRNPMTPNVFTFGGVLDRWACEIATGDGIMPGTALVGVSVVLVTGEGTERCHELSRCFSDPDVNAGIDAALVYLRTLDDEVTALLAHRAALAVAERLGHEAGVAAGSWVIDGNSSEEDARRLLQGIEDGDPEILDQLPSAPLSGEWADGPLPADVIREVEAEVEIVLDEDAHDEVLRSYEDGFAQGVEAEAVRSAQALVQPSAPKVVVLNHGVVSTHIASLHREGCRDIEREQRAHASQVYGPYASVSAAMDDYLDSEMVELGYGAQDVKVHPCCRDRKGVA